MWTRDDVVTNVLESRSQPTPVVIDCIEWWMTAPPQPLLIVATGDLQWPLSQLAVTRPTPPADCSPPTAAQAGSARYSQSEVAIDSQRDLGTPRLSAIDEHFGAVDRIDDPTCRRITGLAALLPEKAIPWTIASQDTAKVILDCFLNEDGWRAVRFGRMLKAPCREDIHAHSISQVCQSQGELKVGAKIPHAHQSGASPAGVHSPGATEVQQREQRRTPASPASKHAEPPFARSCRQRRSRRHAYVARLRTTPQDDGRLAHGRSTDRHVGRRGPHREPAFRDR